MKLKETPMKTMVKLSPPARGAWIETRHNGTLRAGVGRPPRGGRGLKQREPLKRGTDDNVAPRAGGVD